MENVGDKIKNVVSPQCRSRADKAWSFLVDQNDVNYTRHSVIMWLCLATQKQSIITGKFSCIAISSPQDCSKRFTLYSLSDLFNRTQS